MPPRRLYALATKFAIFALAVVVISILSWVKPQMLQTTKATNRLLLTFSKKERLAIQERLQEQHVFINATNSVASLENELDFLHPDLSICEDIFEMSLNKSEFAYIWWELDKYARVLADMTTELETKGRTLPRQCFEGYSHRYPGESQMMAKLAR